jgi:hypothetical protein
VPTMDDSKTTTGSSSDVAEPQRTPAYEKSFRPNTDKLSHLLVFSRRATETYFPQLADAPNKISAVQATPGVDQTENLIRTVKEVAKQAKELTGGILLIHELMPVLIVTIVEAYLKDVLIYAAGIDDTLMARAEQTASYKHIAKAGSLQELLDELRGQWARKFVDNGGPTEWMRRLDAMGARGYSPNTPITMEGLWGVRHLVVHSAGIVTPEFVRRHPHFQKKIGDRFIVSSSYFKQWFAAIYDFVQVTDLYFLQRCQRFSKLANRSEFAQSHA